MEIDHTVNSIVGYRTNVNLGSNYKIIDTIIIFIPIPCVRLGMARKIFGRLTIILKRKFGESMLEGRGREK